MLSEEKLVSIAPSEQRIPAVDQPQNSTSPTMIKKKLRLLDPSCCRPWLHHNRNADWWLTPERCEGLIASITQHGQAQPGLVRAIEGSEEYDYEVIFGLRRWYACSEAGIRFTAEVTSAGDLECSKLMMDENEYSEDISELEKCFSIRSQVGTLFDTGSDLAQHMGISKQIVGRRLVAAKLQDYPEIMAVLRPVIPGVSIAKAKLLVDYLLSSNKNLARSLSIAKALSPTALIESNNLHESLEAAKDGANKIIAKLMASPKTETAIDTKRLTTYLSKNNGKPVVGLADDGKGKITLTLLTKDIPAAMADADPALIIRQITDDLLTYLK